MGNSLPGDGLDDSFVSGRLLGGEGGDGRAVRVGGGEASSALR